MTINQITNAFIPSKEITDAKLFAGRTSQIRRIFRALNSDGTNIAIIGGRGIGKTSLSRQILNIGDGKCVILDKLKIKYDSKLEYLPVYFACGNNIKTIGDLLNRLLTTKDCLATWIYDIPTAHRELAKYNGGVDLKVIRGDVGTASENESIKAIQTHEIDVIFQNVVAEIIKLKLSKNGILIVIDEFDQIEDPSGFAKLLKSLATNIPAPGIKFCIVGVAQDIKNLMKEHESVDRLFTDGVIELPYMSENELNEIISNAESSINKTIQFDTSARKKMIELASGHPYFIHLFGKVALDIADSGHQNTIDENTIDKAIKRIAEEGIDPNLESRYKKCISSSYQREEVLKFLAANIQTDGEIPISEMQTKVSIDNPSSYVGQLTTEEFGAEISKIREKYYRFKDSLFAAYTKARPCLTSKK
jgi:Cdc6-like AAA superfamily ATPase